MIFGVPRRHLTNWRRCMMGGVSFLKIEKAGGGLPWEPRLRRGALRGAL